ncbi:MULTISPECIES: Hpt domain-containing protein [unclassified Polaribacter]|uniref:Hpt domain-containing protein n=1 Tax=unclassified Polaribacter TaxID=196858 RepID=UPI0011BEE580|nr:MULTISPECIES: Hpt domain-containing protein [unclassified Polaribacter]TXD51356.1 Hpt domain-containing protein [Polaribacter sp. IC063]TXD61990.1 Hpt domain-containing protein [Polaribacter sp. IC066]
MINNASIFLREKPYSSFIKEISGDDLEFENNILTIIREEFLGEAERYNKSFKEQSYTEASNSVHKIKHKISLLSLHKGLEIDSVYEIALKLGNTDLHNNFIEIL